MRTQANMGQDYLVLRPIPPFRLDMTAWVLRRRPHNIVDRWDGVVYKRVLTVGHLHIGIAARQIGSAAKPSLRVRLSGRTLSTSQRAIVKQYVEKLLGINTNLKGFYRFARCDKNLGPVVNKYIGFKPPRYASIFEAAVNGICSQQLSLTVAIVLLNRLAMACSGVVVNDGEPMYGFPEPAAIAQLKMGQFKKMGFSTKKANALVELARNTADDRLKLESLEEMDDEEAVEQLMKLRGLGRWTAEYILLRGLGRLHIYPSGDIGLRNGLKRWLQLADEIEPATIRDIMSRWKLYGGMVYFHLLLEKLSAEGFIS
jgi:DNA-3-methyladenine glycosylase II